MADEDLPQYDSDSDKVRPPRRPRLRWAAMPRHALAAARRPGGSAGQAPTPVNAEGLNVARNVRDGAGDGWARGRAGCGPRDFPATPGRGCQRGAAARGA